MRKAFKVVVMLAPFLACSVAHSQVSLKLDYGLDAFRPKAGEYSNKTIDASAAHWTVANSKNALPSWSQDCNVGGLPVNRYPLILEGQNNFVFEGGIIHSNVPQKSEWKPTYCNSAALGVFQSTGAVVDGIRIVGAWDATRFAQNADRFTLANAWISNVRDDCLENDQLRTGTITNTLFDGCFSGISTDPGANDNQGDAAGTYTVTLDRVLLRMKAYPYRKTSDAALRSSHGHIFKSDTRSPSFKITNSVFAYEAVPFAAESRLTMALDKTVQCEGNHVLWLSDAAVPSFFNAFPASCFTVVKGAAARQMWAEVRTNWIDCHADHVRVAGDDVSVPENCDKPVVADPMPPTNLTSS